MRTLKIFPADNVEVMLDGERAGHKIASRDIRDGEKVIKYGHPIGFATRDIKKGEWVHTHNLRSGLGGPLGYEYRPELSDTARVAPLSFMGYPRREGRAGIRNEIWIIPTVGCIGASARAVERRFARLARENIDGVYAFPHPYGCSQLGVDAEHTLDALVGLIRHPNAGGVLVMGLGCENTQIDRIKERLGSWDEQRVKFMICQQERDEVESACELVEQLIGYASGISRTELPASELVIGLKCGGSDGFSGITANPLLGRFSDRLAAMGGTVLLSEVPEMFGAETILMSRCRTRELFEQTVGMINRTKLGFIENGCEVYENPSPGNRAGGITTLEEKSLGCILKGGTSPVEGVLRYGEQAVAAGLNLLEAPGNDLVSSNAEVISGAQLVLFTTGRGTPFGTPAPVVKVATNSALAENKPGWIDFDAGRLLGGTDMEVLCDELFRYVLDVASGRAATRSERSFVRDFCIYKTGVTL